jgi:hypothetical protein
MRLDFCVACGVRDTLHHHHLTPRIEGGSDDDTNLITLCEGCHGRIHGRTFKHHRVLQRLGIEKAKLAGVYKGRLQDDDTHGKIIFHRITGLGATEIAKRLKVGRASVYRVLRVGVDNAATRALQIPITSTDVAFGFTDTRHSPETLKASQVG